MSATAKAGVLQSRVIELVNDARARGRRCGSEKFGPTSALILSDQLSRAARGHAQDMAKKGYFEHRAPDGSEPRAARVS